MRNADAALGVKDYPNELDILQAADDVQGNGVFDPAGSHGNVHADYGVFADHQSLPGYVARDQFYTPSEVIDATTGKQVMYVPSGAVSIDDAQRRAFNERLLWELPPGVSPYEPRDVPGSSTWIPYQAGWPIGQTDQEHEPVPVPPTNMFIIAAVAGLSLGLVGAILIPKKR